MSGLPGFVSNRLQYVVLREALHLVETGISQYLFKELGDQVEKAVQIARMAGREVATPAEASEILSLPRREGVA
jgi:hypothetical protein